MAKITNVCFKTKRRLLDYEKYQWMCNICTSKHIYDSRQSVNESYLQLPVKLIQGGKPVTFKITVCKECSEAIGEAFND